MRRIILALALLPSFVGLALADDSVAGRWRSNLGHGFVINMDVTSDGQWSSETWQNKRMVRKMDGTYTQDRHSDSAGDIVFTPTEAKMGPGQGPAEVERDAYNLQNDTLHLESNGDTMVFHRRKK